MATPPPELSALLDHCGDRAAEKMESPFMSLQLAIGRVVAATFDEIADAAIGLATESDWDLERFGQMLKGNKWEDEANADTEPSDKDNPDDGGATAATVE